MPYAQKSFVNISALKRTIHCNWHFTQLVPSIIKQLSWNYGREEEIRMKTVRGWVA